MIKGFRVVAAVMIAVACTCCAAAADFPAWMGANPDGFVAVDFSGNRPTLVTTTPVDSLPQPDAYCIRQGVKLPDQNSYTKAMEDFCS